MEYTRKDLVKGFTFKDNDSEIIILLENAHYNKTHVKTTEPKSHEGKGCFYRIDYILNLIAKDINNVINDMKGSYEIY